MSNVSFKGNVGKIRGLQFSNDGKPRLSFSVAEGHSKPDGNGGWTELGTTWWSVTVFGREAEALAETIQEGAKQRVVVMGRAMTREYEANGEKRTSLDVIADSVGIIPKAQQATGNQPPAQQQSQGGWNAPAGGGGWGSPSSEPSF